MCGISTTWGPRYEAAGTLYAFETKKERDEWVYGWKQIPVSSRKMPKGWVGSQAVWESTGEPVDAEDWSTLSW